MMYLDDLSPAEFDDLRARFAGGKLKSEEVEALRLEARRCLRDPTMMLSDDFREQLEMMSRSLGGEA